ncbi:MAG: hypothetical protein ACI3X6_04475 [Alloprevotella sp.]
MSAQSGENIKEEGKNCPHENLKIVRARRGGNGKKNAKNAEKADFLGDNLRRKKKTLKFDGVKNNFCLTNTKSKSL